MMTESMPSPPPFHCSPSAATLASFPARTFMSRRLPSSYSTFFSPQCRFTATGTTPRMTGPGMPTPTPMTSSLAIFLTVILDMTVAAMSGRTFSPPFSVRVGISHLSIRVPLSSKSPHFTVVPPTSIPKQYLPIFSYLAFLSYFPAHAC